MKKVTDTAHRIELMNDLRAWMPKGSTVYTIVRSVARSGMSRVISPMVLEQHTKCELCGLSGPQHGQAAHKYSAEYYSEPIFPEYKIAQLLGWSLDKNHGIKVQGCGMDMGFHMVYTLASILYDDGNALKQRWL